MPVNRHELRDLLDERSRPAFDRPIPWESLRFRAHGPRGRRHLSVVVACAVALTAVAVVTATRSALPSPGHRPQVAASVVDELPPRLQTPDGKLYERVATAVMDSRHQDKVTFDVRVRDRPLALLVNCPASSPGALRISVTVPGEPGRFRLEPAPWSGCRYKAPYDVSPLPPGTRTATFTVEMTDRDDDPGPQTPSVWRFGVYEWTPPATPARETPPTTITNSSPEFTLVGQRTASWHTGGRVTLTVPHRGRPLILLAYCAGDIAGRAGIEVRVNGRLLKNALACPRTPSHGMSYTVLREITPDAHGMVTVRVGLVPKIPRSGTLTAALYEAG
ncbi:hypothetical protein ABGB17_28385 [Sphaerisporangium sp. B11E5]|uniref:hypothetical protein n=1 Tax=Sphaerisporangium sp. B11E5 TaxID=3153563 RepID=UPI00325D5A9C